MISRRKFIADAFKIGGVAALCSLGLSPKEIQAFAGGPAFMGGAVASAPAGVTYLVEENCEGTGTPSGWKDAGTVDWDYTTTVLRGSQSLAINGDYSNSIVSYSAQSQLGIFFRFRCDSLPASNINIAH